MSSRIYLSIDFGSTYTKLTAIDLDKEEIISTARATTTVKTNVLTGFNMAFEELTKDLNDKLKDYEIVKKVACSSAAGGLKIIAIGLVPELTTEAAKKAALSSGARVIKTYAFNLTDKDIEDNHSNVIVVEFKRPGREDLTKNGLMTQIYKYIEELKSGEIKSPNGIRIEVSEQSIFNVFIIYWNTLFPIHLLY